MTLNRINILGQKMAKVYILRIATGLFILQQFMSLSANGQGDLLITPRRIVFEGNNQRQEITLANTGQDTATYAISFVQYHMTDDGSFEVIAEPRPGQMFADQYLRFFPRSVTLPPNESQVIRMQLRRMPGMEEGEYRSHIYFRSVPRESPLGGEVSSPDTASIGIRLTPVFGITIPVIIRVGNVSAKVMLSEVQLQKFPDNSPLLQLSFLRSGNQSVYGDLTIDYELSGGERINVGSVRGIAVYTPNTLRRFSMRLSAPEGVDYNQGKLRVRFSSANDAKPETYDEKEVIL